MKTSLVGGCALVLVSSCALQANVWIGSNPGKTVWWGTSSNWSLNSAPNNTTNTGQNTAEFYMGAATTAAVDNVTVTGSDRKANRILVGLGKTVNLTIAINLELAGNATSIFGSSDLTGQTGTGSSTTTFVRSAGATESRTVTMGRWIVGYDGAGASAHTLVFSGLLEVAEAGTDVSLLGFRGSNNRLRIEDGARVARVGLNISSSSGYVGNEATVTGAGSQFNATQQLNVGSNAYEAGTTASERYNGGARLNGLTVEEGAVSSIGTLTVGRAANARSNFTHVNGSDSLVTVTGSTFVGDAASLGGNELVIGDGGRMVAQSIFIATHAENEGLHDGANRLVIATGGTLTSDQSVAVNGLLRLEAGGTLAATSGALAVQVYNGGRFEVEGSGLASSVTTTVENGGVLALGSDPDRTSPVTLALGSALVFTGGTLELTAWSGTSADQVEVLSGGSLSGVVRLSMVPEGFTITEGDVWTVFTGDTSGITATFDFSQLGFSVDTSRFSEAGGWQLAAIPEPSTYALMAGGGLLLLAGWRRRRAV